MSCSRRTSGISRNAVRYIAFCPLFRSPFCTSNDAGITTVYISAKKSRRFAAQTVRRAIGSNQDGDLSTMSRLFTLMLFVAAATLISGCTGSEAPTASSDPAEAGSTDEGTVGKICGHCGDEKGAETCCSDSAEKCDACGKNKGSLLCCVELDEAAAGKDLCGLCGQVAGADECCADDAEKCDACGLSKGSPLCCKLEKEDS